MNWEWIAAVVAFVALLPISPVVAALLIFLGVRSKNKRGCSSAVERDVANVEVEGSIPFIRSKQNRA